MKKVAFLLFMALLGTANLRADDQIATVQQELKDQGFYYGKVDGQGGPETTAAIRRYQIRNGLQVDGTLNKETLDSLKIAGNPQLPPQPAPLDNTQPQQTRQNPPAPKDISQNDRDFLAKQNGAGTAPTPQPQPPPPDNSTATTEAPPPAPRQPAQPPQSPPLNLQFAWLFARTPYETAPAEVQQNTLRNAQILLARATYYNGEVDGIPGPATARAILAFQANGGLAQSGRLDLQTLSALHLLPHQAPIPVQRRVIIQPFYPPPRYAPPQVYRGPVD